MDVRKFSVATTGRLHLRDASRALMYADGDDGAPDLSKPMAVNVFGPGSKQYSEAQVVQQNQLMERMQRTGKSDQTAIEKREQQADFLSTCTSSFENIDYDSLSGADLFKAVYSDVTLGFITDQVSKYIGDWANFQKASTAS